MGDVNFKTFQLCLSTVWVLLVVRALRAVGVVRALRALWALRAVRGSSLGSGHHGHAGVRGQGHLREGEGHEGTDDDRGVKNVPEIAAVGSGMEYHTQIHHLQGYRVYIIGQGRNLALT